MKKWTLFLTDGGVDYVCHDLDCVAAMAAEKPEAETASVHPQDCGAFVTCAICFISTTEVAA